MPKGVYTRKPRVQRTCAQCGTVKDVLLCYAKRGQYKFCGRTCYDASRVPAPKPPRPEPIDPLIANVRRGDGCWEWTGSRYPNGYGSVPAGKSGRNDYAHRVAWERASGKPIPEGMGVYHVCDNPPCTRNDEQGAYAIGDRLLPRWGHLFLGTTTDNVADKVAKGRQLKGERHHGARLTDADVIEMRRRHTEEGATQTELAGEFGVHRVTARDVIFGVTWRHLL